MPDLKQEWTNKITAWRESGQSIAGDNQWGRVLHGHISSSSLIPPLPFLHDHHSRPNPTGLRPRSFQQ